MPVDKLEGMLGKTSNLLEGTLSKMVVGKLHQRQNQPDQLIHRRDQLLNLDQELLLSMDLDLHRDRLYWCFLSYCCYPCLSSRFYHPLHMN